MPLAAASFHSVSLADGARLPYADAAFSTVMCNSVLAHVDDLPGCLAECRRVLRAEGRLVATVPTPRFHGWFAPARVLTAIGLGRLARTLTDRYDREWHQVNVLDRADWQARLEGAGLRLDRWVEYFDRRGSFVWSAWFFCWRLGVSQLTTGAIARRVFPAGATRTVRLEGWLSASLARWLAPVDGLGGSALIVAVPRSH